MMGKNGKRTGLAIAMAALALALAVPASASAATTVLGRVSLSAGPPPSYTGQCGTTECTILQIGSSSAQTFVASSPVDGTITSWSFRSTTGNEGDGTVFSIRTVRAVGGGKYQAIQQSNSFTLPPDHVDKIRGPFSTSIPVKKGNLIAMVETGNGQVPLFPSASNADTYADFYGANALSNGGPAMSPVGNITNHGQQLDVQATITFTPPPDCPPNCPPPPPAPPGAPKPVLSGLAISPKTFRAASRGGSIARKRRPPIGTTISYRLSQTATTAFTLERRTKGRRVNGKCVAQTRRNRTKRACTRYVRVRGSFSRLGAQGANRFRFTGRLRGRKLSPGSYRLSSVASNVNGKSSARTTTFKIVK